MPILRQTSGTVSPLASSRSASRSIRAIWSAVHRFFMSPSWAQCTGDSHFRWTNSWGADQMTSTAKPKSLSLQDFLGIAVSELGTEFWKIVFAERCEVVSHARRKPDPTWLLAVVSRLERRDRVDDRFLCH